MLGNGHLLDQVLRRSGVLSENSPKGAWDNIAEQMLLEFAESGHPIFRATTPMSSGSTQKQRARKLSIHFTADQDTVGTIYRIILSVKLGAVATICENLRTIKIERVNL